MNPYLGQTFALLTALCFAQNSLIYSHVGKQIGSSTVAHIRLWLALPMLLVLHTVMLSSPFPFGLPAGVYASLLLSGFIGFFIADLFLFKGFVEFGPRETLVVLTTSPIFSAFFSYIIFAEALTAAQIVGIMLTVAGVIWVISEEHRRDTRPRGHLAKGAAAAFAGTITQSAAMVLAKGGMASEIHPVSGNLLRLIGGFAGLVLFASLRGRFLSDFRTSARRNTLLLLAFAAAAGPVMGIIFTLAAMNLAPLGIVTALSQVSPIFLLPFERFVLRKRLGAGAFVGTLLAIAGSAMLFLV